MTDPIVYSPAVHAVALRPSEEAPVARMTSLDDVERMAAYVAASRMFPGVTTKEAAITLMLLCQAEGLHPMQALLRYHIIQNRPAMKADAMLAEFMNRGGTIHWLEWTNEACEAKFTSKGCPEGVKVRWTIKDAETAGITSNATWKKYPRQMLKARVASDGVRMADPGVNQGRYTPEEVESFDPQPQGSPRSDDAAWTGVPLRTDAEILSSVSLDVEQKPLGELLEAAAEKRYAAVAFSMKCKCKSEVQVYRSQSKDNPGRRYYGCMRTYDEIQEASKTQITLKALGAKWSGHTREWAEKPLPKGVMPSAVGRGDSGEPREATTQFQGEPVANPKPPVAGAAPTAPPYKYQRYEVTGAVDTSSGPTNWWPNKESGAETGLSGIPPMKTGSPGGLDPVGQPTPAPSPAQIADEVAGLAGLTSIERIEELSRRINESLARP